MATKKRTGNKQPGNDSALDEAVEQASKQDKAEKSADASINARLDPDTLHLRDVRPE